MNARSEDQRKETVDALKQHGIEKREVTRLFGLGLSGGSSGIKFKRAILGCVCLLFVGALVAGSCVPDSEEETGQETQIGGEAETTEEPVTIGVTETEYSLYPEEVILDIPGTYVFRTVNNGSTTHALKIEGQGVEEVTENLAPDENSELIVDLEPGTYEFYCPVGDHRDLGMEGTITVRED